MFDNRDIREVCEDRKRAAEKAVNAHDPQSLMRRPDDELVLSLLEEHRLKLPRLRLDRKHGYPLGEGVPGLRGVLQQTFVTCVPFEGSASGFFWRPVAPDAARPAAEIGDSELVFTFTATDGNPETIRAAVDRQVALIERHLTLLQRHIDSFHVELEAGTRDLIAERRKRLATRADFLDKLGIPLQRRPVAETLFTPPRSPRPSPMPRGTSLTAGPVPVERVLADEEYEYILGVLDSMSVAMERSPRTFARLGEQQIRDFFLVALNGHYKGQATGETFNGVGKTDILIRYEDVNVFIAECKFWDGPKVLLDALDQLLGYVTWRDTKTALIVFNRKRAHSTVLGKLDETILSHPCHRRRVEAPRVGHSRHIFHRLDDPARELVLTVLAFDVPTAAS